MATEIVMPKLSDTMTEGRLIAWQKSVGDRVERGEVIALVETDKANMELEAFVSGILLETRLAAGESAPVGTVIALIGSAGERPVATTMATPVEESSVPPGWQPPPEAPHLPLEAGEVPERVAELPESGPVPAPPPLPSDVGREKASPLVRRLARERGIELAQVTGSGPGGRILEADLERFVRGEGVQSTSAGEVISPAEDREAGPVPGAAPLTRMRAAIARTVTEAWRTTPHFSVTVAVDMGEAERVRHELKESGTSVSVTDMIVAAAARALAKFPRVNGSFTADGIQFHGEVNVGIAVALDDGLLVPVLAGCERLSLNEIAVRGRELAIRARQGVLAERELAGGTFSISNLGMYGVEEFTAVIHPNQGAILAVGAIADTPVIRNGQAVAARMMRATLSADHRLLDGAEAARFMAELKRLLENPVALLV